MAVIAVIAVLAVFATVETMPTIAEQQQQLQPPIGICPNWVGGATGAGRVRRGDDPPGL